MELTVIGLNAKGKKLTKSKLAKYSVDLSMYVGRHKVPVVLTSKSKNKSDGAVTLNFTLTIGLSDEVEI